MGKKIIEKKNSELSVESVKSSLHILLNKKKATIS
jgi:hypothetical protein